MQEGKLGKFVLAGLVSSLTLNATALAQETVYWPASASQQISGQSFHFPMGTPISLVTRTQLTTKDNKAGDRIYLEVAESLVFRGQIVVPVGSLAVGEVVRSERNGHFGKKGKLEIRLLHVQTPSGPVRLTGRSYDEGKSGTAASVATMVLVSGLGFLIHGTSGKIEAGSNVIAYLADPLLFTLSPQQQSQSVAAVQPEDQKGLPATFDPTVFSRSAYRAK